MFYSKSMHGFYSTDIHEVMPSDVVEISDAYYQELLDGQAHGKEISGDQNGWPVLIDRVDTRTCAEKRVAEYPSIGDQLDALFHAGVFPAEMAARIQAVKDQYPKG